MAAVIKSECSSCGNSHTFCAPEADLLLDGAVHLRLSQHRKNSLDHSHGIQRSGSGLPQWLGHDPPAAQARGLNETQWWRVC